MNKRQEAAVVAADHLVGNLWFNLSALPLIAGRLSPDAMPETPAAAVYEVMCSLFRDPGSRLSAGAVEAELKRRNFNFDYLSGLQSRILPEDEVALADYANTINDAANLRRADLIAGQLQAAARKGEQSAEVIVAETLQRLTSVAEPTEGPVSLGVIAAKLAETAEAWQAGVVPDGLATGLSELDRVISLREQELVTIAARPSMGKSALAFDIALNVARQLRRDGDNGLVAIFSAEMGAESVAVRFACSQAQVNSYKIRRGTASKDEYIRFQRAVEELKLLPIHIDETANPTTEQVFYRAAMLNAQRPIRLLIFDFLELSGNVGASEELRVGGTATGLKNVAKALKVPVIALSQLSRKVEERADKIPTLADLRYSGNIEAVSDIVVFIMRPQYYFDRGMSAWVEKEAHKEGVAYAFVAKQRNGPVGRVALSFSDKHARFDDLHDSSYTPKPSSNGKQKQWQEAL